MEGRVHRSWLWTNRVKIALGIAIFEGLVVAFEKDFSRITVIVIAVPIILFYLLAGRSVDSQLGREVSWVLAASQAFADTHYVLCYGGGRRALYYSAVFPVPTGTKSDQKAKAFDDFVKGRYGTPILAECHSDLTQASAESDKKSREDNDQTSRFPSRIVETGWAGK